MKAKLFWALLATMFLQAGQKAHAQYQTNISADRPGATISAFTVGKKVLQGEHGVTFLDIFPDSVNINVYTTEHVVRYGLGERFELNALFEYQADIFRFEQKEFLKQHGTSKLHLGFRTNLCSEKKWRPTISFQSRITIPRISKLYGAKYTAAEMTLSTQYSLPKDLTFVTLWSMAWDGNSPAPIGRYALNLGFPIAKKLNGYIENYSNWQAQTFQTRVDGGIMYLIGNDLQLDLSAGFGRNQGVTDYFVATGLAWRVKFKDAKGRIPKNNLD